MEQRFGVEQMFVHEDFDKTDEKNNNDDIGKDVLHAPGRSFAAPPVMFSSAAEAEI